MLINNIEFKVGADPEVFVSSNNNLVSGYGLIPGTKKDPFKVKNGAVQVDGMALEFNIDPATSFKMFNDNINSVMGQLKSMVPNHNLEIRPVAEFGEEYIKNQPYDARVLGCDPDYNAYTGLPNPTPNVDAPFRTASGHIHIGWGENMDDDQSLDDACRRLTRELDKTLGIISLLWDKDHKRRELYGKAGSYRRKPYGVEYRTLSNMWLSDKELIRVVFNGVERAIKNSFKLEHPIEHYEIVRKAIDTGDYSKSLNYIIDDHSWKLLNGWHERTTNV